MPWGEAMRLVLMLLRDSTTAIWDALSTAQHSASTDAPGTSHVGDAGGRSPEEVRAMLRELGHHI